MKYFAILAYSTNHAISLEKKLRAEGVKTKMIPVPRHISSDCGVCLRISEDELPKAEEILEQVTFDMPPIQQIS